MISRQGRQSGDGRHWREPGAVPNLKGVKPVKYLLLVVICAAFLACAVQAQPRGATQVKWPNGLPDVPTRVVDIPIGRDLNALARTGPAAFHKAPVAPQELQLLCQGWRIVDVREKPIGTRPVYEIGSQNGARSSLLAGMFAPVEVTWRVVTFERNNPGPAPSIEPLKKSWSYRRSGVQQIKIDYYWANVPTLIEMWEVKTQEVYTRVGVVDP